MRTRRRGNEGPPLPLSADDMDAGSARPRPPGILPGARKRIPLLSGGGDMDVGRRAWISFAAVAAASLALVPPAQAAFGLQDLSGAPASTNAGAHSDVDIHIG